MQRSLEEESHVHVSWQNLKSNHTSMGPVNEAKLTSSDGVKFGSGKMLCGGVWGCLDGLRGCVFGVEGALEKATGSIGKRQGKGLPSGMGDDKVPIMRWQATAAAPNHNHLPPHIT